MLAELLTGDPKQLNIKRVSRTDFNSTQVNWLVENQHQLENDPSNTD